MKTYHGSCHCGAVRFEADIDMSLGTIKCNCTICTKMRFWGAQVGPDAFRLLEGKEELGEYRYHSMRDGHFFCKRCGIHTFSTGDSPRMGPFYAVFVACLDDLPVDELMGAPVRVLDGRNDNWATAPSEIRHL
ncbi:GFA family protein [Massilia horti]|uniref:GFA family protein n=1 Tax=Massilia horti TaxID=2562153 RepID=A0A4Y9T9F4_9BURK|nr:GFA family protein [Massilia horti]TFW36145.1 GFA family protein [Massilia horti]